MGKLSFFQVLNRCVIVAVLFPFTVLAFVVVFAKCGFALADAIVAEWVDKS